MCYKSYVGCSTDFDKTIDELRKREFGYVLQKISATWANALITPGQKRATQFSRLRAFQALSGCRFQAPAVVLRLYRIQEKATCENETDVRATPCATPTNENVPQIIVSPCESRATKSVSIHDQKQRESASMARGSGKGGERVEKSQNIRGPWLEFPCDNRTTVCATKCATFTNKNVLQIRVSADKMRATKSILALRGFNAMLDCV